MGNTITTLGIQTEISGITVYIKVKLVMNKLNNIRVYTACSKTSNAITFWMIVKILC